MSILFKYFYPKFLIYSIMILVIAVDLSKSKYIILELIPTSISKDNGVLVQLSALKLEGIKLLDRFDYRLKEEKVPLVDFIELCSYDKESFTYLDSTEEILTQFEKWSEQLPLLIIDNNYTRNYLEELPNEKESVFSYLNLELNDQVIENMILKYHLKPSNYIVDLIYETLIQEID